jgi:hypothetical protein
MDWSRSVAAMDEAKHQHEEWRHEAEIRRIVRGARAHALPQNGDPSERSIDTPKRSRATFVRSILPIILPKLR